MTDHAQLAREMVSHFKIGIKNAEGGMILEFNQDGMTSLVEDALTQAHAAGRREGLEEAAELAVEHSCPSYHELCDCRSSIQMVILAKSKEA